MANLFMPSITRPATQYRSPLSFAALPAVFLRDFASGGSGKEAGADPIEPDIDVILLLDAACEGLGVRVESNI